MQGHRGLFILSLWLAACLSVSEPAEARGLDKRFEFGRLGLGAEVNKVPPWALRGDCKNTDNSLGHCGFQDAQGVNYLIFDFAVCEKTLYVGRNNIKALPYGMDYRWSKPELIARVSKKLNLTFEAGENGWYNSNTIVTEGFDGVAINLRFDRNGKLSTVNLWSNCT